MPSDDSFARVTVDGFLAREGWRIGWRKKWTSYLGQFVNYFVQFTIREAKKRRQVLLKVYGTIMEAHRAAYDEASTRNPTSSN